MTRGFQYGSYDLKIKQTDTEKEKQCKNFSAYLKNDKERMKKKKDTIKRSEIGNIFDLTWYDKTLTEPFKRSFLEK